MDVSPEQQSPTREQIEASIIMLFDQFLPITNKNNGKLTLTIGQTECSVEGYGPNNKSYIYGKLNFKVSRPGVLEVIVKATKVKDEDKQWTLRSVNVGEKQLFHSKEPLVNEIDDETLFHIQRYMEMVFVKAQEQDAAYEQRLATERKMFNEAVIKTLEM